MIARSDCSSVSADAFVPVVQDIDLVCVPHAECSLIVDDADVAARMNVLHLIRGLPVARKDLIEFRQDLEAQRLVGAGVYDLDATMP
jgi:hypothetical protein